MAREDIFDKEWVDERDKNNLEGLLEQMNLPPAVVTFVRDNKRAVQAAIVVVIIAVVAWSLYDTYRDNRIEKSSEALSAALETEGQPLFDKLADVESEYSGTDAALWAQLTAAQQLVAEGRIEDGNSAFKAVREELGKSSILQPLVTVGVAQTAEALGNYDESRSEYQKLIELEGYEGIGYMGLGRIRELEGDTAAALEVYERYLGELDPVEIMQKQLIEDKIASIKARN